MGNCHCSDNKLTEAVKELVVKRHIQYKECALGSSESLHDQAWESRVIVLKRGKLSSFKNKVRQRELVVSRSVTSLSTEAESILLSFVDSDEAKLAVLRLENSHDVAYIAEAISRLKRPAWTDARSCEFCRVRFTFFRRKHHCRQCGHTVCARCSAARRTIPSLGYSKPQRLCSLCTRDEPVEQSRSLPDEGPQTPTFKQDIYVTFAPVQVNQLDG